MNKIILTAFIFSISFGSTIDAYFGQSKAAERYYQGEISMDEYLDSTGIPKFYSQESTIYHNDGTKSLIRSSSNCPTTIYHNNGTKSLYYNIPR